MKDLLKNSPTGYERPSLDCLELDLEQMLCNNASIGSLEEDDAITFGARSVQRQIWGEK